MQRYLYRYLCFALLFFTLAGLQAQVKGISYTIAPGANYTWFNNRAGLNEAFMVGGRVGLGFGEYVELRGLYFRTVNGTLDLGAFDVNTTEFDNSDVDLARYGAELKLNIGRGKLLPYLLVGGGVQDVGRQGLENAQNIFGTAGLGLTLAATDRFNFSIEGSYLAYRFNAVRNLLDQAERDLEGLDLEGFQADNLGNWSIGANLGIYLGGRKPGELSDIDRAYLNTFGNGIKGLRIPFEAEFANVNFDNSLNYRDAWFAGLRAGVDIGPYVGLRAFYLQGMDDNSISFNFDDLAMYGADLRLNLGRAGRGFTPFVTLGGGRINVQDGYVGRDDESANSQGFASGGGGLSFQLAKSLRLNGSYRILLTSREEFGEISNTDQLTSSNMWSLGLNLAFGNSPDPDRLVNNVVQDSLDRQAEEYDERIARIRAKQQQKTQEMREKYENRIGELEDDLNIAMEANDFERADSLRMARDQARLIVAELEDQQNWSKRSTNRNADNTDTDVRYFASPNGSNPYGATTMYGPTNNNQPRAYQNPNQQTRLTLTYGQVLDLVRAATGSQPTVNNYYQDPYGSSTPARSNTGNFDGVNESTRGMRNRASQPTDRQRAEMNELRKELSRMRDEANRNNDRNNADRYQRMLDYTYDLDQNASSYPNGSKRELGGQMYLGTDPYGRQKRKMPDYRTPDANNSTPSYDADGNLIDPGTMRNIKGFDPDAKQPKADLPNQVQPSGNTPQGRSTGSTNPQRPRPNTPSVKPESGNYKPYDKDGTQR